MTAVTPTPGQVVYEAHQAFMIRRFPGIAPIAWDELSEQAQGEWEGIAGAGIAAYTEANGNDLRERAEAAEAAKRQAKGDLADLEDRLAKVIAAAVTAEQARAEAAEAEASRLRDLLAEQERAAGTDAEYMAPRDAARVLRVDPTTLVTFESAGKLTTVRTPWGHRRYRTADVKALRREREARRG